MREEILERRLYAASARFNVEYLDNAEWAVEEAGHELAVSLRASIWENSQGQLVVEYYANLREHIRAALYTKLPCPLVRRLRPVRHTYKVFSCAAMYPEAHVKLPPEMGRVVFALREAYEKVE